MAIVEKSKDDAARNGLLLAEIRSKRQAVVGALLSVVDSLDTKINRTLLSVFEIELSLFPASYAETVSFRQAGIALNSQAAQFSIYSSLIVAGAVSLPVVYCLVYAELKAAKYGLKKLEEKVSSNPAATK